MGVRVHTRLIDVGVIVSGELVPAATVRFAVTVASFVDPFWKRNVRAAVAAPAHPAATRTVYVNPAT